MSWMNSNYRPPNYNTLRRDIQGALATLTFSDGVSIDIRPFTAQGPRPALRVTFRGEIYTPNFNSRLGPLKETPYYDIILETKALEQKSRDAARPEDIRQIVNVLNKMLETNGRRHGGTRRRKSKRSSKTLRNR